MVDTEMPGLFTEKTIARPLSISSPSVSIKPLESCHAPAVLQMMDQDICNYLGRRPCENLDEAIQYVYDFDSTQPIRFAITHHHLGFIGVISFGVLPATHLEVVIGYWIGHAFQKQGYASQAIQLLLSVLKQIDVYRVLAEVYPNNTNSSRLLERLGFSCEDKNHLYNGQLQYRLLLK